MVTIGLGMGLTSAPATEAIMGVVPAAKAGIGSAVNDATRELGGTLGVAVIGSVSLSVYRESLAEDITNPAMLEPARDSVGAAMAVSAQTGDPSIVGFAQQAFIDALQMGCFVAVGVSLLGFVLALIYLPNHPVAHDVESPTLPVVPRRRCPRLRGVRRPHRPCTAAANHPLADVRVGWRERGQTWRSRPSQYGFRSSVLRTFCAPLRGSASMTSTEVGALKWARRSRV